MGWSFRLSSLSVDVCDVLGGWVEWKEKNTRSVRRGRHLLPPEPKLNSLIFQFLPRQSLQFYRARRHAVQHRTDLWLGGGR